MSQLGSQPGSRSDLAGTRVLVVEDEWLVAAVVEDMLVDAGGIPFLFVTGYGQTALPRDRPDWEAHAKPFHPAQLTASLLRKIRPV